jgi:hypothetical protein
MPFFLAQDGIQKLNNENNFIATYNDPAISQEMTEEEKEKYLSKNSINF